MGMIGMTMTEDGCWSALLTGCRCPTSLKRMIRSSLRNKIRLILSAEKAIGGETRMTPDIIRTIESILARGDRVELIPVKDGVRVVRVKRETVKA